MSQNGSGFAMLEVSVTTCSGILPVKGARVTVNYCGMSFEKNIQSETHITDECGTAAPFIMKMRCAKIKDEYVYFPRNRGCSITVYADGYAISAARDIPIFSGVTVKRSFDLIPQNVKNDA